MIVGEALQLQLARAVCGDDHLECSWPGCGCKMTKRKIAAVIKVVAALKTAK